MAAVLSSPLDRLTRACGDDLAATEVVGFGRDMRRLMRALVGTGPLVASSTELLTYLMADMAGDRSERVRVFFLDLKNRLLADETIFAGTLDATQFSPREIIARALDLNAAGLIVVHNHPSGDPSPSAADRRHTRRLVDAATLFGITVLDHIVIAARGAASVMEGARP